MRRLLISAIIIVSTSFFLVFTINNSALLRECFSRLSYFIIFLLFCYWLLILYLSAKEWFSRSRPVMISYSIGIAFSIALTSLIFISTPPTFRLLADEANLISVSKSMTFEHRADMVLMGDRYYYNFYPEGRDIPTRPLLFPFLINIINVIGGYHASNAFIVNFLVVIALFMVVYALTKDEFEHLWGCAGVLLVAAQPVITLAGTSAGFDLLAALLALVSFASVRWFLLSPSPLRLQLLWVNLLMLANVRYESCVLFVITILFLQRRGLLKFHYFCKSYLFVLTPFLLLPLLWQRMIHTDLHGQPVGTTSYAVGYLFGHSVTFLKNLWNFQFYLPYANVVNIIGVVSILYFSFLFARHKWPTGQHARCLVLIANVCVGFLWIIYAAYSMGDMNHPMASRFYIVPCLVLSIFTLMLLKRIPIFLATPQLTLLFSITMFALYHPIAVENRFTNTQILVRQNRIVLEFLSKMDYRNFLLITDRPGLYTIHDIAALSFEYVAQTKVDLLLRLRRHLYKDIFVIQEILYETNMPTKDTAFDPAYKLESLFTLQNDASSFVRISRIVLT